MGSQGSNSRKRPASHTFFKDSDEEDGGDGRGSTESKKPRGRVWLDTARTKHKAYMVTVESNMRQLEMVNCEVLVERFSNIRDS